MKRKADPSWDRDNSDESEGENKKFPPKSESTSDATHPAVDLSKRRIVKLKLPSEILNESVARTQPKPTGTFQLASTLSTTQPANNASNIQPAGSISFLSNTSSNQSLSNKPSNTESTSIKPNLSLSAETLNSEPFKDQNQTKSNSLFGNLLPSSDSNSNKPSDSSNNLSNSKQGSLFGNNGAKPDSAQKFGLFGRSTSGEKSPLAQTPLVSGKTSTPDKPLDQSATQGGLFANIKTSIESKPAAFTFGNTVTSNASQQTNSTPTTNGNTVSIPSIDEQPKLVRQDSTQLQLQRADSKNITEEKQQEAAAAKREEQESAKSEAKNINLFSNTFQAPGQKSLGLFGNQPSGSQPFNLTPKTEEKVESKTEETSSIPPKNLFGGLLKQEEKKTENTEAPKQTGGLFGKIDTKPTGISAPSENKSSGIFGNLLGGPKPESLVENNSQIKHETPTLGIFANKSPGGPLFAAKEEKKPEPEPQKVEKSQEAPKGNIFSKPESGVFTKPDTTANVQPLVTPIENKPKISLFSDILKKEEPKPAETESKPTIGGVIGKLFNNSGDLSQLAKKDYSQTKFDTSGEDTENAIKEAEKERREKEKAKKDEEKPKANPWSNLNNPSPSAPTSGPSKSGLFGTSTSSSGLFANINDPNKPNIFAKSSTGGQGLFTSMSGTAGGSFLLNTKKNEEEGEGEDDGDGEDPEAEKEVLPTGGAPTLNKDAFKYEDTTDKLAAINVAKFKGPETALFQGGEISLTKPKDGKNVYYLIYRDVSKLVRYQAQVFPNISKVEFFNPRQDSITIIAIKQKEGKAVKETVKAMFKDADECKKFKDGFEKNLL